MRKAALWLTVLAANAQTFPFEGTWVGDAACLSLERNGGELQGHLAGSGDAKYQRVGASVKGNHLQIALVDAPVILNLAGADDVLAGLLLKGDLRLHKYTPAGRCLQFGHVPSMPILLKSTRPQYTEQARLARVQGRVVLEAKIQSSGRVGVVRVLGGLGDGLDEKAVECVREWRFSPPRMDFQPTETTVRVDVEFRL